MPKESSDLLSSCDLRLRKFLETIKEFNNKNSLIQYYVDYENPKKQQKLLRFWESTLEKLCAQYYESAVLPFNETQNLFYFGSFIPLGLEKIMEELVANQRQFIDAADKGKILKFLDLKMVNPAQSISD